MIKVENLTKTYDSKKLAVDSISFTAESGEIFGFLGPNGAGKTTSIKMITGILKKDSGLIEVEGINIDSDPIGAKKIISYVPDNPDIPKRLHGIEYLNFLADIYEVDPVSRKQRVSQYAELFEIAEVLNDPVSSYSHGMQQKLAVIGALVSDPQILILDEPMVGLDPKSAFNLKELMKNLCEQGKTVFFSTHVLDVAEKFCDKVGIINKGKMVACASLSELRSGENTDASLEQIFLELTEK